MKLFLIILLLTIQLLADDQVEVGDDISEIKVVDENITLETNINVDTDNASELTDSNKSEILIEESFCWWSKSC